MRFIDIIAHLDFERSLGEIHFADRARFELRAEFLRLFAHILDQFRAQNAIGKSGEILHVRGQGELPAGFVPFQNERAQIGARGVDRRRQPRTTTSDNHDLVHAHGSANWILNRGPEIQSER